MTGFDLPTNYVENPEALLRWTKAKLKKVLALDSEDNYWYLFTVTCLCSHLMLLTFLSITFTKLSSLAMVQEMLIDTS